MSRRGLVSKGSLPAGGSPGGVALMPKGGKPTAVAIGIDELATTLRVAPSQIHDWMDEDKLRGNEHGVKPYDFKKFQLGYADEIRRAQAQALADSKKTVDKKPQKTGFFSRLFGGGKKSETSSSAIDHAKENKLLREELKRAQEVASDVGPTALLEDKVRYLEKQLSKSSALEQELRDLKLQLHVTPTDPTSEALKQELEATHRELHQARTLLGDHETLKAEFHQVQEHHHALQQELRQHQEATELSQNRNQALQVQLENLHIEKSQLEQALNDSHQQLALQQTFPVPEGSAPLDSTPGDSPSFVEELLQLQEVGLNRYRKLHEAHQRLLNEKRSAAPPDVDLTSHKDLLELKKELARLKAEKPAQDAISTKNGVESEELSSQLQAARELITQLENEKLALETQQDALAHSKGDDLQKERELNAELEATRLTVAQLREENHALTVQHDAFTRSQGDDAQKERELNAELDTIRRTVAQLREENHALAVQHDAFTRSQGDDAQKERELNAELDAARRTVARLQDENHALAVQHDAFTRSQGDDAQKERELHAELDAARRTVAQLQEEKLVLQAEHSTLRDAETHALDDNRDLLTQLKEAHDVIASLKETELTLKAKVAEADIESWPERVAQLQAQIEELEQAQVHQDKLADDFTEMRKALTHREDQVQKVAARLQENERALKKALKESTRLTELLVQREKNLTELRTEIEQEFHDKVDSLDRQVSGLQWKLSLREERIAHLETEVSGFRRSR